MKSTKCIHKWATAILGLGLAVGMAPVTRAQAQSQSSSAKANEAATPNSADTQKQLDKLQKEVSELQSQIAALKAGSTPTVKTAAMTSPASPSASAMAPAPAADDAPAKVTLAGLLGPTTISGLVDGYYQFNSNHPIDNSSGFRFFDANTNAFSLNIVELGVQKNPDASSTEARFGYHVVAGYGQAAQVVNQSDPFGDYSKFYLEQAYGSYLAPIGKGLQIDVGKFVTPIGGEVIESNGNWNYSRGILFYYAIPFFHVGARATYAFNSKVSVAAYLVNGWNNSGLYHDCCLFGQSAGLNYIGSITWAPTSKLSIIQNYIAGPTIGAYRTDGENITNSINDWKQLSDTVISYTLNDKWAFLLNGDYGFGPRYYNSDFDPTSASPAVKWWGVAGYAKYTINPKSYFATRYEYYDDTNGYTGVVFGDPGFAQEVTGTYAYSLTSGLQVRAEYRYDFASEPIFTYGGMYGARKTQNTAELGFMYTFSSANAK